MRTVAVVQARMGSTRFPGKTLEDLAGRTLLERVCERVARARCLDALVVATTADPGDDEVARVAAAAGYEVFRGSAEDVLDRYVRAARAHAADVVVRNTADEPFCDPALVDEVHRTFVLAEPPADYAANNLAPVYPEGLDTEVVAAAALETAWREATLASDREHVTPFLWRQPERFRLVAAGRAVLRPDLRLTVDYPADLEFARAVWAELPDGFGVRDVVALIESRPDLAALCPVVPRREGYRRSLDAER